MPSPTERFLVGPRDPETGTPAMAAFLDSVREMDGAEHVSGDPERHLVVQLSPDARDQLSRRFSNDLIIEPDAPLSL